MSENTHQEETKSAFPLRWPISVRTDRETRLIEISDDRATPVFDTLTSETARELLSRLHTEPQTASDLAESVDTSVQNVKYHLQKFEDAGLVEVVDQWYSSRGTAMNVYGPPDNALVLYTGKNLDSTSIRDGLSQVIGAVALLGVASLAIDYLVRFVVGPGSPPTADSPGGSSPPMNPVGFEFMDMVISPGMMFFVGGAFALAAGMLWWYWRQ
jgi:DNA-binding transcriptional ArsR family regulator